MQWYANMVMYGGLDICNFAMDNLRLLTVLRQNVKDFSICSKTPFHAFYRENKFSIL